MPDISKDNKQYADRIVDILERISEGDYSARVTITGEFGPFDDVAKGINRMADELQYAKSRENDRSDAMLNMLEDVNETNEKLETLAMELEASQEKFKALFENAPDAYYMSDLDGNFIDGNRAAQDLLGYDKDELIGKNFLELDLLVEEDAEKAAELLLKNVDGVSTGPDEFTLKRSDGTLVPVDIVTHPVTIGEKMVVLGIARDISDRKETEKTIIDALEESNARRQEVESLLEGARAVLQFSDFIDAAKEIFKYCKQATGGTSGYVALLNENLEENDVLFLDSGGLDCTVDESLPMPICGLRGVAYEKGEAVYHNDFMNCDHVKFMPEGHVVLNNVLFAPLKIEGKTVGIMGIANKPGGFNEHDVQIATAFGDLAAIALQNSRNLEMVKESEGRFRTLFDSSMDAIMTLEPPTWKFTSANPATLKLFNAMDEFEFVSKGPWDVSPEFQPDGTPSGDKAKTMIMKAMEEGSSFFEWTHSTLDGRDFPATVLLTRMELESGNPFLQATVRDISKDKEAENALKESEEKFRSIIENSVDVIFSINKNGDIIFVSPAMKKMLGYSNEDVLNKNFRELIYPEDIGLSAEGFEKQMKGGMDPQTFRMKTKDGGFRWVSALGRPRTRGKEIIFSGVLRDISEKMKTEKAIEESEERFRDLFENANDMIQMVAVDGTIEFVNSTWLDVMEYSKGEVEGKNIFDFLDPDCSNHCMEMFQKIMRGDKVEGVDAVFRTKTGKLVEVEGNVNCKFVDGKPTTTRGIFRDVTETNKSRKELEDANKALIEADKMKDQFLSVTSHELRSPLAAMIGVLDLIRDGLYKDEDELKELIGISHKSANELLDITNDLLDLAKIESGKLELNIQPVAVNDVFHYMDALYTPKMNESGLDLNVKYCECEGTGCVINADEKRFKQVMRNLIGNALKFTDEGSITISTLPDEKNENVVITIKDTGIGISKENMDELFKPFSQLYKKTKKKIKGTGLGLSICKSLIEQMGGTIWMESEGEGTGTIVTFKLPRSNE